MQAVEDRGPGGLEVIVLHIGRGTLGVRRGRLSDAADHLHAAHVLTLGVQDGRMNGLVHDGLAELARIEGRLDDARQAVIDGLARIADTGDDDMIARLCLTGMHVEAAIVDRNAADARRVERGRAHQRGAAARDRRPTRPPAHVVHPRGGVRSRAPSARSRKPTGSRATRPPTRAAAVAAWARLGTPYGEAFARWRHAEALFAAGRRDDAAEELRVGHERAIALGAVPLRDGIEALARRARRLVHRRRHRRARRPERSRRRSGGLTPRELDVLRLVVAGSTNRQIGAALYISEKTASVHVSRILAKLGVSTRGQAAAAARRRGLVDDGATGRARRVIRARGTRRG